MMYVKKLEEIMKLKKYFNNNVNSQRRELDKILGLELWRDDYITKPFSIRELLARIKGSFKGRSDMTSDENDEIS